MSSNRMIKLSSLLALAVVGACSNGGNKVQLRTLNVHKMASGQFTTDSLGAVPGGLVEPNAQLIPLLGENGNFLYGKTTQKTQIITNVEKKLSYVMEAGSIVRFVAQNGGFFRVRGTASNAEGASDEVEGFVPAANIDDAGMEKFSPTQNAAAPEFIVTDSSGAKAQVPAAEFFKNLMQRPALEALAKLPVRPAPEAVSTPTVDIPPETIVPEGCKAIDLGIYEFNDDQPYFSNTFVTNGKYFLDISSNFSSINATKGLSGGLFRGESRGHGVASFRSSIQEPVILIKGKAIAWRVAETISQSCERSDSVCLDTMSNFAGSQRSSVELNKVNGPIDLSYEKYSANLYVSPRQPSARANGAAIRLFDIFPADKYYGGVRNFVVQGLDATGNPLGAECKVVVQAVSPLVLDFSGAKMIATTSISQSNVRFDLNADGVAEKSGWVNGSTSAFLALDLNGNGSIDNGHELFGNATKVETSGKSAANGFLGLAQYDKNNDGRIDTKDAVFGKLTVWFDKNNNGVSEKGEVQTLAEAGVTAVSVRYSEVDRRQALQHQSDVVANDVRYKAQFWGAKCPSTGCAMYDVFFGTIESKPLAKR